MIVHDQECACDVYRSDVHVAGRRSIAQSAAIAHAHQPSACANVALPNAPAQPHLHALQMQQLPPPPPRTLPPPPKQRSLPATSHIPPATPAPTSPPDALDIPTADSVELCLDALDLHAVNDEPQAQPVRDASVSAIRQLPPLLPTAEQWRDALRDEGDNARVPQQRAGDAAAGCARVRELHELFVQGCDGQHMPEQSSFDTSLRADLRSELDFAAVACNAQSDVWALWAQLAGGAPQADEVCAWARDGVLLRFCDVTDTHKATEPHHLRKLSRVRSSLRAAGYTPAQQAELLCGDRRGSVVLADMLQPGALAALARETLAQNVARAALVRWPAAFGATRPNVVAPVFVVADASGKLRLIVNARYTNLFVQGVRCYFQTIWDLVRILSRDGYVFDFKAGYLHWLLAAQH